MNMKFRLLWAGCFAALLLIVSGCVGDGTWTPPDNVGAALISDVSPCHGNVGDEVVLSGEFTNVTGVTVSGVAAEIISNNGGTLRIRVPNGATTGPIRVDALGASDTVGPFEVGTNNGVAEVEPNDDINGSNATRILCKGSGALSSPTDKDHFFREDILDTGHGYRLKLTPKIVSVVYVNGSAVSLDANGEAVIHPPAAGVLIGLTGGVGAYSVELERIP
jgi:hypothetical protein